MSLYGFSPQPPSLTLCSVVLLFGKMHTWLFLLPSKEKLERGGHLHSDTPHRENRPFSSFTGNASDPKRSKQSETFFFSSWADDDICEKTGRCS